MSFRSKLPDTGTTIFQVMSSLAVRFDAINLSQGFPDFDCADELKALVTKYMAEGKNQYAPMPGLPALKEVLATKMGTLYEAEIDPELNITITAGATQALFTAIGALVSPGDEVIMFDPAYDCYGPSIKIFGGIPKPVALNAPDFRIDWDEVEALVTERTVAIIVNTPHNPLGKLLDADDMLALQRLVLKHGLYVVSDEVYEHITFDGRPHESLLKYPELFQRAYVTFSFGKVFHNTGWKTGYCVAPEEMMNEFRKVHQYNVYCVNTPLQYAFSEYLRVPDHYLVLPDFFQKKRDFFIESMKKTPFKMLPSEGSYFILADYSTISDLPDMEFARWLVEHNGVATIPLSPFYSSPIPNQKLVRFCFAKSEETLEEAARRLSGL